MTYTRASLIARINAGIKNKQGMIVDMDAIANDAVRFVVADIDLNSCKRKANLSPNLFTDVFEYACPTDLNNYKIIALNPQTDRLASQYSLVPFVEFSVKREIRTIAVSDNDNFRKVLINAQISDKTMVISTLDALTSGGGTWTAVGDATNLTADSDNYVENSASIKFDIGSGGLTTAGIQNTGLNSFDISTTYLGGNSAVFCWVYITSTTGLTNYILGIGNDSSNCITKTVTAQSDGTAFRTGWNLLRFDLSSYTTVGTPTLTACTYASIYMTKAITKISETGYRFDHIMAKKGEIHELYYYSQFGWQSSVGVYKENSTDDSDYVNAGPEEYNLMIKKGVELAADECDEDSTSTKAERKYKEMKKAYEDNNPSEAMIMTTTYKTFEQDA